VALAVYVHYLLSYHKQPKSLFQSKEEREREKDEKEREKEFPDVVARQFANRFTEKSERPGAGGARRLRTRQGDILLLEWILCCAMHASGYVLRDELVELAQDTGLTPIQLMAHCKELGFAVERVKRDRPEEDGGEAGASAEEAKSGDAKYVVRCKCPLTFPAMPEKRTPAKRS
jgi:hypothetical protein